MNIFTRSKNNPILKPDPKKNWESRKLYNPGVIYHKDKYHLFYRAVGKSWKSVICYATSDNGENFKKHKEPVLTIENDSEKEGLEDPRITKIGDIFFMAYAAYDGITPRLNIATSKNLTKWKKDGKAFHNWNFKNAGGIYTSFKNGKPYKKEKLTEWSKSGGIFPSKINNKYWMLFGEHRIWLATSDDGLNWEGSLNPFLNPRQGNYFDNSFVEMGPPPIDTELGWLVLYHGIDNNQTYRIGFLILDKNSPLKILYRSTRPIFEPKEEYETFGMVDVLEGGIKNFKKLSQKKLKEFLRKKKEENIMPGVIFCCGTVLRGDNLEIFYGAGDSVICKASTSLDKLLKIAKNSSIF